LPVDGFERKRTGSNHSLVGPAVTRQRIELAFVTLKERLAMISNLPDKHNIS
jgi:hypothetical protein